MSDVKHTHEWEVIVRGVKGERIESYLEKVSRSCFKNQHNTV